MNRKILKAQLRLHEDERAKPYNDVSGKTHRSLIGKLTVGIGRNLEDKGLSPKEIEFLLDNDIDEVLGDLNRTFPWFANLSSNRQHVLMDMCFNLGLPRLLEFKNTLMFMSEGKYEAAAGNMLASKWADQVGNRAKRLAHMMKNDVDYTDWKA